MEFTIIALDANDENAMERRLAARDAHLALHQKLKKEGHMLYGGAILKNGKMAGSNIICKFDSREEFDNWINNDPYVTEGVWKDITVYEYKSAPGY